MRITDTRIKGLKIIDAAPVVDARGSFARWFCARELGSALGGMSILQINHSKTIKAGSVRGMHFQKPPHGEMKLVRCIKGRVWDVSLDVRAGSPTFLQWHAEELSADNAKMMVIPERCAHGFQVLEPDSELLYLHTAFYDPASEGGVRYDDPMAGIQWPLPPADLSDRDKAHPALTDGFKGV